MLATGSKILYVLLMDESETWSASDNKLLEARSSSTLDMSLDYAEPRRDTLRD